MFHFSRLGGVPEAEDLASQMLKGFPRDRVSAQEALAHDYFSVLPSQLYQLPDGECVCACVRVRARGHLCIKSPLRCFPSTLEKQPQVKSEINLLSRKKLGAPRVS